MVSKWLGLEGVSLQPLCIEYVKSILSISLSTAPKLPSRWDFFIYLGDVESPIPRKVCCIITNTCSKQKIWYAIYRKYRIEKNYARIHFIAIRKRAKLKALHACKILTFCCSYFLHHLEYPTELPESELLEEVPRQLPLTVRLRDFSHYKATVWLCPPSICSSGWHIPPILAPLHVQLHLGK